MFLVARSAGSPDDPKKEQTIMAACFFCAAAMLTLTHHPTAQSTIVVDCQTSGPADLVKKFDMCQTGHSGVDHWLKAARGRIEPLKLRHIRIVGALLHKTQGGQPLLTEVLRLIQREGAAVYLCLDPNVLERGRRRLKPTDLDAWRKLLTAVARQAKSFGCVYYEVWNEPNYDLFFKGTPQDLFDLYKIMVETVSKVDPDARFVGPGFTSGGIVKWTEPFLQFVDREKLPLHAFAFHEFGRGYDLAEQWIVENSTFVFEHLGRYPRFADTEVHIGECSFFPEPVNGGPADRAEAAAHLPHVFRVLVEHPRITLVQWAQLFDTGSTHKWGNLGVIDIETGKPKPVYNVFLMYAMMPVPRIACCEAGPVKALASKDDSTVAVMLYNTGGQSSVCDLTIENHSFADGPAHLTRLAVDADHSSFWEKSGSTGQLECVEQRLVKSDASSAPIRLTVSVPGPGAQLLLLSPGKPRLPYGVLLPSRSAADSR